MRTENTFKNKLNYKLEYIYVPDVYVRGAKRMKEAF